MYLAERAESVSVLSAARRRRESDARNHRAAVLLGLHAARRREYAADLRVRAAHR